MPVSASYGCGHGLSTLDRRPATSPGANPAASLVHALGSRLVGPPRRAGEPSTGCTRRPTERSSPAPAGFAMPEYGPSW